MVYSHPWGSFSPKKVQTYCIQFFSFEKNVKLWARHRPLGIETSSWVEMVAVECREEVPQPQPRVVEVPYPINVVYEIPITEEQAPIQGCL